LKSPENRATIAKKFRNLFNKKKSDEKNVDENPANRNETSARKSSKEKPRNSSRK
jgi:hypothetical protein